MMMPMMFSRNPARIICGMLISPVEKTIALGGVATGSMNAQLAAIVIGTVRNRGDMPSCSAIAPITGSRVAVVARLLVSSVRKITRVTDAKTSTAMPSALSGARLSPSHNASPEFDTTAARLKPPPNRINTPQGMRTISSQTRIGRDLPLGSKNNMTAAVMTIPASLIPGSPANSDNGRRSIQEKMTAPNTAATRFSAVVMWPSSSRSSRRCASTALLAGICTG